MCSDKSPDHASSINEWHKLLLITPLLFSCFFASWVIQLTG
jgi:hypothetical protein